MLVSFSFSIAKLRKISETNVQYYQLMYAYTMPGRMILRIFALSKNKNQYLIAKEI